MSEAERLKRLNYKKNRKKWMSIQLVAMVLAVIIAAASFITFYNLGKAYYIDYTEAGDIDYRVYLKENDFFEEEYLGRGQSYVSTLIDTVSAEFKYKLATDTNNVAYDYSYGVKSRLEILDSNGTTIFDRDYTVKEETRYTQSGGDLEINERVDLNYDEYNALAATFIERFKLPDTTCNLIVTMNVRVTGSSAAFEEDSKNSYAVSLLIPLTRRTLNINMTSSVPEGENKILAYSGGVNRDIFGISGLVSTGVFIMLLLIYVAFIYLTRNHDINYSIRVKRLVSAYRPFIQQISNPFDTEGYQVLYIKTFSEMLGIRDTIQSPILMHENEDETRSQFIIPTATKILYLFEIKVDNYDEIYGTESVSAAPITKEVEEEVTEPFDIVIAEEIEAEVAEETVEPEVAVATEDTTESETEEDTVNVPEEVAEPVQEEESPTAEETAQSEAEELTAAEEETALPENTELKDPDETPLEGAAHDGEIFVVSAQESEKNNGQQEISGEDFERDEATRLVDGVIVHIRYRTSFTSRLIQSDDTLKGYYTVLKNKLLSYKGVKARTSWNFESFNKGRINCAKLNVRGSEVRLALGLDPEVYGSEKCFTFVGDKPKLDKVPLLMKIKSERSLKNALAYIETVMKNNEIAELPTPCDESYNMPYETTEQLVDRGFVKVLFPDGIVIDGNTTVEKLNIDALIREAKSVGATVNEQDIEDALAAPTVELEDIDFVDEVDEVYVETEDKPGVEVIGVVWPEHAKKNKIYRYDPNGEILHDGDIVLVPTRDAYRGRDIVRKASVAHGNHKVDPQLIHHPLKKIITVVKRKLEEALSSK